MHNVTVPTPVALAAGALCLLGGYMLGALAGPDRASLTTAVVDSYDRRSDRLCLTGEAVAGVGRVDEEGVLCGTWLRTPGTTLPREGQDFRFTVKLATGDTDAGERSETVIYGDVVD